MIYQTTTNLQQFSSGFRLILPFDYPLAGGVTAVNETGDTWEIRIVKPDGSQILVNDYEFPDNSKAEIACLIEPLNLDRKGTYYYQVSKTTGSAVLKTPVRSFEVNASLPNGVVAPVESGLADYFPIYDSTGVLTQSTLRINESGALELDGTLVGGVAPTASSVFGFPVFPDIGQRVYQFATNIPAGHTDAYLVPAGKRLFVRGYQVRNLTGTAGAASLHIKDSGGTYRRFNQQNTVNGNSHRADINPFIVEAGETLAFYSSTGSMNYYAHGILMDNTSRIKRAVVELVNGDNTVYTVPSGKRAFLSSLTLGVFVNVTTPHINVINDSGSTISLIPYFIPNGATKASIGAWGSGVAVGNLGSNTAAAPELMNAGDSLVVEASVGASGARCYILYMELDA